ncbi:hypothetical protein [Duganella callida]|uniref:DUF3108 domain-containing protein n=1 Tax=Duganella callida TaxID=2561932 RepID=A0A4Y9SE05_9BURK|nr:hypothetical protein [Duganella callida]TFW18797.1 hypothetical protein E4L98_17380 [Duganella callida]
MINKRQFAALCFFLPCAFAQGANPEQVPPPAPAVGDSWTYQYTDVWKGTTGNINRLEVNAIDDAGIHVDIKRAASGALVGRQLFSPEMNPVERGNIHFAPAFARYAFPLAPGKEWSSSVDGDNPKLNKHLHYNIKGKVLDWEKVKVPAGEFDALKIVVDAQYGADGSQEGGQMTETVWFVPALNNFVKLEYRDADRQGRLYSRDAWELMSFVQQKAKPAVVAAAAR